MATVQIREINEAVAANLLRDPAGMGAGDSTDKTAGTIRFKQAMNATVDANNPIPIPAAGVNRSFEKCLVMRLVSLDGDNDIRNLRFYTNAAASPWTGVSLFGGIVAPNWAGTGPAHAAAAYTVPVMTDSAIATLNAFTTWTPAAPLDLDPAGGAPQDSGPFDAPYVGDHVGNLLYLQMDVGPTAAAGTLASTVCTFSWDET